MAWTKPLLLMLLRGWASSNAMTSFRGIFFQGYRRAEMLPARLLVMISHRVSELEFSSDIHSTVASDGTRLLRSASL
ncbi:hypothetical protein BDR05DRAFT_971649 [Suillus weaverae]|nr:hypothetical protein BDR05DRAFT_971654 [Suillus weaverae]KAG2335493.1 hypothetical protein BDR05DRAFT_971649 [Suillus weaverae]